MKAPEAVARLAALAQETRLELFRKLVRRGPEGLAAGALAAALDVPPPTLSFHLATLERAGLISSRREGRSILYAARYPAMDELVGYLLANCCVEGSCTPVLHPAPRPHEELQ
ncbi:MAG: helix-turn-helix transcriptional regulator [Acidobacteria bacterium]|jgi:DNA-binding transcriptional ArsR family regulator|nr:helix-turn-helix transcriptional regulator [Thermoanaerobaculia bacterium]MDI9630678.1 metalloregulator ArsR/SmtB family transcription factor [Acidobacteriota bacterium]MBP7813549.1 helix-turn-helix transcriptional regulator [Thermoanaerobaculia bacterium]MBP8844493.1 helix-turn-helix transcriptional regulator [Thermoanaerobaculia bacterium]NLN11171.1 helix-turn-helix transcriptional regulator [Acidobacteriota bacterium]